MAEIILTDQNFEEEVIKSEQPVLVDFYADWCPPCKAMAPIIEKIAQDFSGEIKVGKMNIDENSQSASQYRIEAIPTLMIFKQGRAVETMIGAVSQEILEEKIKQNLS